MNHLSNLRSMILRSSSISSLPQSISALSQLQVLDLNSSGSLKELPEDIGNVRSLRTLDLRKTSILSVPESILDVRGLQHLVVDEHKQLPLHIGRLTELEELPDYHVGNEEGPSLDELNLMNRLKGKLTIASMQNIDGVEEAGMADLNSKKNVRELEFRWNQPGNEEEMDVKIMEALEPHHALESLMFCNYGGDKFPAWKMPNNVCVGNLRSLRMEGLNKICEMVDMEYYSLRGLFIENCPKLRKVLMATPNLTTFHMSRCGDLESVDLFPSLSDNAGMHTIVSQLQHVECDYNIYEYISEKLKTANSKLDKLRYIKLSAIGRRVDSLPDGCGSMMESLREICDIDRVKYEFLLDGDDVDQSAFPPSTIV